MNKELVNERIELDYNYSKEYFESIEEFEEYSDIVKKQFKELKDNGYKEITFRVAPGIYSEYGEDYPYLSVFFDTYREKNKQELDKEKLEKKANKKLEKAINELNGKIPDEAIFTISHCPSLLQLYLDGKLNFN